MNRRRLGILGALTCVVSLLLQACRTSDEHAAPDEDWVSIDATPYWSESVPCNVLEVIQFDRVPLGAPRVNSDEDGQQTFQLSSGVKVVIEPPEIMTYSVRGPGYSMAYANMLWREVAESHTGDTDTIAMASVVPRFRLEADTVYRHGAGSERYRYQRDGLRAVMSPLFMFPEWTDADQAPVGDQLMWEKMFCSLTHHEIAHVLIDLQGYEERLPELLDLRSPTSTGLRSKAEKLLGSMAEQSLERHDSYHRILDERGRNVMEERPYLTYDWPWRARSIGRNKTELEEQ